jgi:dihydrofolate reductase
MSSSLSLIVAMANNGVIGRNNQLPWHLPADLDFFKQITMGQAIVMGRKTHEAIARVLPGRLNIVISRQSNYRAFEGALTVASIAAAREQAEQHQMEAIIIGGAQLYAEVLPLVSSLYVTHVDATVQGDTVFPDLDWSQWQAEILGRHSGDEKHAYSCIFKCYRRVALVT